MLTLVCRLYLTGLLIDWLCIRIELALQLETSYFLWVPSTFSACYRYMANPPVLLAALEVSTVHMVPIYFAKCYGCFPAHCDVR